VLCGCWTREEFGVIQHVNRQWGCGLVQFLLLFFLPKALVLGSAVTKINHMQFLMAGMKIEGFALLVALDAALLKMS
jgi:hypothetical protein